MEEPVLEYSNQVLELTRRKVRMRSFNHWRKRTAFVAESSFAVAEIESSQAGSIPAIESTDCGFAAGVSVIVF